MTQPSAIYEIIRLRARRAGLAEVDAKFVATYATLSFQVDSPTSGHRALVEGGLLIDTLHRRTRKAS